MEEILSYSDFDIMVEVLGKRSHLPMMAACREVAEELYGTSAHTAVKGIQGRVYRADTPSNRIKLAKWNNERYEETVSDASMKSILKKGEETIKAWHESLTYPYHFIFVGDMHIPYIDWQAMEVVMQIVDDLDNVRGFTALNDAFEFAGASRWPDKRTYQEMISERDYYNSYETYGHVVAGLSSLMIDPLAIAIQANHDRRIVSDRNAPDRVFDFTRAMDSIGVTFQDVPTADNAFLLDNKVMLMHGSWNTISSNLSRHMAKNISQAHLELGLDPWPTYPSLMGHMHRSYNQNDKHVIGCLCQLDLHYNNKKMRWNHGMGVIRVYENGVDVFNVRIKDYKARLEGKTYG